MKTALRTIAVASLLLTVVAVMVGQQPKVATVTGVVTIAGDSTVKTINGGTVEYLPNGVIWVVACEYPYNTIGKNVAYLSTDHGSTWVKRPINATPSLTSPLATGLAAKDANTAVVVTRLGEILRTSNGGVKWDTVHVYSPGNGFFDGVRFVSGDTVVAYGDADELGLFVARSFDAGKTWTRVPNTNSSLPGDSLNAPAGVGLYAGYASYGQAMETYGRTIWITLYNTTNDPPSILKSTDAGNTWSWFRVTLPGGAALNNYIRSISFKDENVGFAVCKRAYVNASSNDNYLIKTTDGGRTWSDTISVALGKGHVDAKPMTVKAIRGTNTVIAVGTPSTGTKVWISNDNGATWDPVNAPSPTSTSDLRNFAFGSTTQGFAIGYYNMAKIQLRNAVNVTFLANTATVPDTLKPGSFVQIRGSADVFGPWGVGSKAILTNIGGDYWKGTALLPVGDTIYYKFFTHAVKPLPMPVAEHQGWEQNTTDGSGNRILIVGSSDMTVPLQFVNGTPDNQPQFFKPYVDKADSIEVWFRVNMAGQESFGKTTQFIGVRGGFAGTYYKDWAKSVVLKQEGQHGNGGSRQYDGTNFWSGYVRVPKSTFTSNIEYKFVIMKTADPASDIIAWEEGIQPAPDVPSGNRVIFASPGISDTTLYWKWWANNPFVPFVGQDTVVVTFRANLQRAVAERGFAFGDTIQVRTGYGGTAKEVRTKTMTRSGLTGTIFTATDTVIAALNKAVNYQYYLVKGGNDVREVFYDFDDASGGSQAERRKITLTSKTMTVHDTTTTSFDLRRMPRFRNTAKLSKNVAVTYTVDVRPAYYTVKSGKKLVATNISSYVIGNADSVMKWGVWMNGPAVGGWDVRGGWGAARRADTLSQMYDDGTHGDLVKGDSVYSLKWNYTTADFLGQEFKFGIGAFDNEGGFGNNHIENIDDAAATYTIASQFGSIDPKFFNSWNFDLKKPQTPTAVETDPTVPMVYQLSQNYPNPFNPTTNIRFTLPAQSVVTLKIFNVLGQEIMTVVNEKLGAGTHTVKLDASRLTSGVYLYQINAGTFTDTKKMVLLK